MEIKIKAAIEDIKGSTGITDMGDPDITLKLKVQMTPGDYARLMNLQKQRVPMNCIIESPQASFDLEIVKFGQWQDLKGNGDSELPAELGIVSMAPDSGGTRDDNETAAPQMAGVPINEEAEEKPKSKKAKK